MKLYVNSGLVSHGCRAAALIGSLLLAGCGSSSGGGDGLAVGGLAQLVTGPAADYPMVVGGPYTVNGVSYVPEDVMNYDEVGLATADRDGAGAISAAHHTLPLPSYVEVTSLETGRTILARIERRGPMDGNQLIALSPGAMSQLGAASGASVRVRRVNPPEDQRHLLRSGQEAPLRMDTPMSLVQVLKRKLPGSAVTTTAVIASAEPARASALSYGGDKVKHGIESVALPPSAPASPAAPERPAVATATPPPAITPKGRFMIQAATFSSRERAEAAARALDGQISEAGSFWRVRTGPFSTQADAQASLAKVKDAGYNDARILTIG